MNIKKVPREINFPENRELADKLLRGDRVKIAKYSGMQPGTVRDMLYGYRRINDEVGRAIIRLIAERKVIAQSLEEITNQ